MSVCPFVRPTVRPSDRPSVQTPRTHVRSIRRSRRGPCVAARQYILPSDRPSVNLLFVSRSDVLPSIVSASPIVTRVCTNVRLSHCPSVSLTSQVIDAPSVRPTRASLFLFLFTMLPLFRWLVRPLLRPPARPTDRLRVRPTHRPSDCCLSGHPSVRPSVVRCDRPTDSTVLPPASRSDCPPIRASDPPSTCCPSPRPSFRPSVRPTVHLTHRPTVVRATDHPSAVRPFNRPSVRLSNRPTIHFPSSMHPTATQALTSCAVRPCARPSDPPSPVYPPVRPSVCPSAVRRPSAGPSVQPSQCPTDRASRHQINGIDPAADLLDPEIFVFVCLLQPDSTLFPCV